MKAIPCIMMEIIHLIDGHVDCKYPKLVFKLIFYHSHLLLPILISSTFLFEPFTWSDPDCLRQEGVRCGRKQKRTANKEQQKTLRSQLRVAGFVDA